MCIVDLSYGVNTRSTDSQLRTLRFCETMIIFRVRYPKYDHGLWVRFKHKSVIPSVVIH